MIKHFLSFLLPAIGCLTGMSQTTPRPLPAFFAPTQADFNSCIVYPQSDDANWDFGEYYVRGEGDYMDTFRCFYDYNMPQDDWLILPQLNTSVAARFAITYDAYTTSDVSYDVVWGLEPTPEAMTNTILSAPAFNSNLSKAEIEKEFDIPDGQNVYIGFHVYTKLGAGYLDLRNITVASVSTKAPAPVTMDIDTDGLQATAYIDLPLLTVGGDQLSSTLSGSLIIDGQQDKKYDFSGNPGEQISIDFSVYAGRHTATCTISYVEDGETYVSDAVSLSFEAVLPSDFTLDLPLEYTPSIENISWLTILDLNGDGITWELMDSESNRLKISYNSTKPADDWAILPAVEVPEAGVYRLTMRAGVQSSYCPEAIELSLGSSADPAAMLYTPIRVESLVQTPDEDGLLPLLTGDIELPAAGKYYIGIHGFSEADQLTLYVSTVTMEKAPKTYDYIDPEVYETLPADMFDIDIIKACADGLKFSIHPEDVTMLYTNILIDETYVTVDGLDELDFADQIVNVSNQMLDLVGGLSQAMQAEFFYLGNIETLSFGGMRPGTRAFLAVMGLNYDETTNTVSAATKVSCSEVFEFTDETLPVEEPYAQFGTPEYIDVNGVPTIRVEVIPNAEAGDYVYGKVYPADYRQSHSDIEIIDYLTSIDNMFETWLYPLRLDAAMQPGEQALFAVATLDKNTGRKSSRLNWAILQAPQNIGDPVIIISSAEGSNVDSHYLIKDSSEPEYYTLDGLRVAAESLTPGIYIRRLNGKTSKYILR